MMVSIFSNRIGTFNFKNMKVMIKFIGHALWLGILALIVISIFGWFALIFVICFIGIVFMLIFQDDNRKLIIAAVSTFVVMIAYVIVYITYIME